MLRLLPRLVIAVTVMMTALAAPADAQVNPFRRSGFDISDADIQLAMSAAAKLYEGEQAVLEDVERWANPETGNQGTVRLVKLFTYNDLPCRRLQHDIKLATVGTPFRYVFDRCKLPTGEWKLL